MPAEGRFDFDAAQRRERGKRWLARCRQALEDPTSRPRDNAPKSLPGDVTPDRDEDF